MKSRLLLLFYVFGCANTAKLVRHPINIFEAEVDINLEVTKQNNLEVSLLAPFYGELPTKLKNGSIVFNGQERAQLVFKNDADEILDIQIGPYGHHQIGLFKNNRQYRHFLPLSLATWIETSNWKANFIVPANYLPEKVTQLSAFIYHGNTNNKKVWSLSPLPNDTDAINPHDASLFQNISLKPNGNILDVNRSDLWNYALKGILWYELKGRKENLQKESYVTLQGFEKGIEINVSTPIVIQNYSITGAYLIFSNKKGEMIELDLHPKNGINIKAIVSKDVELLCDLSITHKDYISDLNTPAWKASILLPPHYLPANTELFNIYVKYSQEGKDSYILRPLSDNFDVKSTLYKYDEGHFRKLETKYLLANNDEYSNIWKSLLEKLPNYKICVPASLKNTEISNKKIKNDLSHSEDQRSDVQQSEQKTEDVKKVPLEIKSVNASPERDPKIIDDKVISVNKYIKESEDEKQSEIPDSIITNISSHIEPTIILTIADVIKSSGEETQLKLSGNTFNITAAISSIFNMEKDIVNGSERGNPKYFDKKQKIQTQHLLHNVKSNGTNKEINLNKKASQTNQETNLENVLDATAKQSQLKEKQEHLLETKMSQNKEMDFVISPKKTLEDVKEDLLLGNLQEKIFLFPPPHPVCFIPGLAADDKRCQVFHECILKENKWVMYTWMCKPGTIYNSDEISCIPGRCE